MSWSVGFKGRKPEIEEQFNASIEVAKTNGIIEKELDDMTRARDYVVAVSDDNGVAVQGSASGSWNIYGSDDPKNSFSSQSVSVSLLTE